MIGSELKHRLLPVTGMLCLTLLVPLSAPQAGEPGRGFGASAIIQPVSRIGGVLARERTDTEMQQDEALEARALSDMDWSDKLPFRPTVSAAEYERAKALVETVSSVEAPSLAPQESTASVLAPVLKKINFEGVNQTRACGTCRPPDTHGAAGGSQFVEVTNFHVDVYQKTSPNRRVNSVSLKTFFGYTTEGLFDPRVVFDGDANRWIISAIGFPEASGTQKYFIAVSKTASAKGSFFIYSLDVDTPELGAQPGDQFDFPQLGMDRNSIIITANIFGAGNFYKGARLLSIAKSLLYNGSPLDFPIFSGLDGPLAPPIVLDGNSRTFLVAAPVGGNNITLYTLRRSNRPATATLTRSLISVPAFEVPPNARQPGTTGLIDTADARFVTASTQVGNSLFQVHTINVGGRPMPKFYEFNTASRRVIQSGTFAASATSHDWNASIAANRNKDVFVTWTSTDVPALVNVQVRYSGRRAADPPGAIDSGLALTTSGSFYNPTGTRVERWGDYSAVTIDPRNSNLAWIVNEKIRDKNHWGSRIGRIGF
jgi:hypothetical protein